MACSVCWRLAASARPRVSSRNRSSSSPAISAGRSAATRAAASSIASGIPSSRRQISPTAATLEGLREKSLRAAAARWTNRDTASLAPAAAMPASGGGSDSGRSPKTCSPPTPSGCWLVARMRTPRQPRKMSAASAAAAAARCSQLSSTSSSALLVRKNSTTLPAVDRPGRGRTRSAAATACAIVSPSPAAASSHSHAPSAKDGSWSAAACSASRVLPTPPGPVTVTSGDRPHRRGQLGQLARPADERAELDRQVPGERLQRAQRRELRAQPGPGQLEDPHRPGQIPQPVLPQVHQRAPLRQVIAHQQLGRPRHQRLPAMPGGHQPGAPVQRLVQVMLPAQHPLIGQQAHPRRQRPGHLPPVLGAQPLLRRQHRADRIPGRGEHRGHPVAHRGEHHPAVRFDRPPHDRVMPRQRLPHLLPGAPPTGASTPPGR